MYWWCPHHKRDSFYDGMYMNHDPVDCHKTYKEQLEEKKARINKETSATLIRPTAFSEGVSDRRQLKLSNKIQASIMNNLKLSKDEEDRLMTTYNSVYRCPGGTYHCKKFVFPFIVFFRMSLTLFKLFNFSLTNGKFPYMNRVLELLGKSI